jgi:hypothetical protein
LLQRSRREILLLLTMVMLFFLRMALPLSFK